jgi:5-methylcytosine-specific restriction endonuclease McrA
LFYTLYNLPKERKMKICWDNLETLKYNKRTKKWYKGNNTYVYKEFCRQCSEPFLTRYMGNNSYDDYCSRSCSRMGKKHSKETIEKVKRAAKERYKNPENHPNWKGGIRKGGWVSYEAKAPQILFCEKVKRDTENEEILNVTCAYCGKWFRPTGSQVAGRIFSLKYNKGENRFYCSTHCKRNCPIYNQIKYPKGYYNPFQDNTSREVQPELRQMVFKRDGWTCQKCEQYGGSLHCHHIDPVSQNPIESADIDNCITLCRSCHKGVHKQRGCRSTDLRCD